MDTAGLQADGRFRGVAHAAAWTMAIALLVPAQLAICGCRFGFGNQSIQIAFLKHLIAPGLCAADPLIATLADYPTVVFHALAWFLSSPAAVEPAFRVLHWAVCFAFLGGTFLLGRSVCGRSGPAFLATAFLVAGHHAGLAETDLYSPGFTHTWLGAALSVLALASAWSGRWIGAFALAALLVPVHALTGVFTLFWLGASLLLDRRGISTRTLLIGLFLAASTALPFLLSQIASPETFDREWVALLRVRSAHHVFPSSWWSPGIAQVPRFSVLLGFLLLGLSAAPPPGLIRRHVAAALAVAAALFAAGSLFSELFPCAPVLRLQPFRCSAMVALLALVVTARWITAQWDQPPAGPRTRTCRASAAAQRAIAALVAASLAVPPLTGLLPFLLVSAAVVEWTRARLAWWAALAVGTASLCCVAAWRQIAFPLFAPIDFAALAGIAEHPDRFLAAAATLTAGASCALLAGLPSSRRRAPALALLSVAVLVRAASETPARRGESDPQVACWRDVQSFARNQTPLNALFIVPPRSAAFRVGAERSIAGDWRDGTQQFFSASFARQWWRRMQTLEPGLAAGADGRQVTRGVALQHLPADDLLRMAAELRATHLVLPGEARPMLRCIYANACWRVFVPERIEPPRPVTPDGIVDAAAWSAHTAFLRDVVEPNIERHRKSDATVVLLTADDRPLQDLPYEVEQVGHAFRFGCVLPHFTKPSARADFDPGVVDPREFAAFRQLFNFSVIGYSGKWNVVEPVEGSPSFEDLDQYVGWCATNGVEIEHHFVSGYPAPWLRAKQTPEARRDALLAHTRALVTRYADRIPYWQVVNEKHMLQESPDAFRLIRSLYPDLKLGISDCARFYTAQQGAQGERDALRGLAEVRWLRSQGVTPDFFAFHAHRPIGVWPDARTAYAMLDAFAAEGVRIHVSEVCLPADQPIVGPIRSGRWTPELQAEGYRQIYTIAFSHPSVDVINLWGMGPRTWQRGAGLLDEQYNPKPAYHALRGLIHVQWHTRVQGRTGLDGRIGFRGFHGAYELRFTSPKSGRRLVWPFDLPPGAKRLLRVRWEHESDQVSPSKAGWTPY